MKMNLLVASLIALLFAGLVQGVHEPVQSQWRTYRSHNAQIQLEVPEDWNVYEYEVCVDLTPPNSILLLKIAPKEVSEEALLTRSSEIEIHVDRLPEPVTLDEWIAEKYSPEDDSGIIKEKEIQTAGDVAVLRERRWDGEAATITEVFAIRDSRGYYFSFRHEPAHEFVFQRLLESLRFQDGEITDEEGPPPRASAGEDQQRVVRLIYLIPSDKSSRQDYAIKMENAIRHLQIWYRNELGNSKSFSLHTPTGEAYNTTHPASWYQTNRVGSDRRLWFWNNVVADGFSLTGGRFDDLGNRWIFYIDADPACGQIGGAAAAGVAVLPANDLRGLTGQQNIPGCANEPPDPFGVCRWVGGLGHELGHTFGLPHPRECEDNDPNTACPSDALMWTGFATYPAAFLLPADKDTLNRSPFFSPMNLTMSLFDCSRLQYLAGRWEATFDWTFSNCPIPPDSCMRCITNHTYSVTQAGNTLQGSSLDSQLAEIQGTISGDSVNLVLKEFFPGGCTRTFRLNGTITNRRITGSVSGGDDNCGTCRIDGTFEINVFS
jgi:hypothetical protein